MSEEPPSRQIGIALVVEDPQWCDLHPDAEAIATRAAHAALDFTRSHAGTPARFNTAEAELTLVLADDKQVRALNHRFRGLNKPTNVLSFADLDDHAPAAGDTIPYLLGDVVLARETIAREAEAQGKALADHLGHLVVHGVLHLLGFDHDAPAEAAVMEALEVRILGQIGIADPYGQESADPPPRQETAPT